MQTTKQLQRFYVVEVFRAQPPIPGSQGSETVSLPRGTSAFDQRQYTTRVNRASVEGTSPSTCARIRFPLHPSLPPLDGVSIDVKDEKVEIGGNRYGQRRLGSLRYDRQCAYTLKSIFAPRAEITASFGRSEPIIKSGELMNIFIAFLLCVNFVYSAFAQER